jgi:hypothetical protein
MDPPAFGEAETGAHLGWIEAWFMPTPAGDDAAGRGAGLKVRLAGAGAVA